MRYIFPDSTNKFAINLERKELFEEVSDQINIATKDLEIAFFM